MGDALKAAPAARSERDTAPATRLDTAAPIAVRRVVTRKTFWPALFGLLVLLCACAAAFVRSPAAWGVWFIAAGVAGAIARVLDRRDTTALGGLDIRDKALFFDGKYLCERAEIETALLVPQKKRKPIVVLKRREGQPLRFEVDGTSEGRALIRALELDPRQTVATFTLPTMNQKARAAVFAAAATVGLLSLVAIPLLGSLLPAIGVALAIPSYLMFVMLTRTKLQIGVDGLKTQHMGKTRFIGHDEIERVATLKGPYRGVEVTLRTGEVVRLPTATHAENDGGLASGIVDLLEAARTGDREDIAREESVLARGGRPASDWLRGMRSLAAGANADHRTAPIDPARVWRVLEDPAAEASARVGAAALLATSASEGDRTRLRIAAKAIAAPRVRVAIETIAATDDEDAVLEALDAVQEQTSRREGH